MLCNAFDQRVDELLDQRESLESNAQIRTHAEVCPRCQSALRAHLQLLDAIDDVQLPERFVPPARGGTRIASVLAVAATLLVAVTLSLRPDGQPGPSAVALNVPPHAEAADGVRIVAISDSVLGRTDLTPRTDPNPYLVHQPLVGLRLLSMGDWSTTMETIDMPFGAELPQVQAEWVDAVAHGISPVQDSFTSTLNLIRRTLAAGSTRQS